MIGVHGAHIKHGIRVYEGKITSAGSFVRATTSKRDQSNPQEMDMADILNEKTHHALIACSVPAQIQIDG
jgi:hypothetical protein